MEKRSVYGSYHELSEASRAVQELLELGVESEDIAFVAKHEIITQIDSPFKAISYEEEIKRAESTPVSFRESFMNFFKDESKAKFPYPEYETDLLEGNILIVVNRELDLEGNIKAGALGTHEIGEYKENIKLHEEHLHVGKQIKEDSRVRIEKKVVEEIQKIEVPVRREELHINRIQVDENGNEIPGSQKTEVLPLSYESPLVQKETVVASEADIEKTVYNTIETIKGKVLKEELLIDELDKGKAEDLYVEKYERPEKAEEE